MKTRLPNHKKSLFRALSFDTSDDLLSMPNYQNPWSAASNGRQGPSTCPGPPSLPDPWFLETEIRRLPRE